jgi:hypothetical protein
MRVNSLVARSEELQRILEVALGIKRYALG